MPVVRVQVPCVTLQRRLYSHERQTEWRAETRERDTCRFSSAHTRHTTYDTPNKVSRLHTHDIRHTTYDTRHTKQSLSSAHTRHTKQSLSSPHTRHTTHDVRHTTDQAKACLDYFCLFGLYYLSFDYLCLGYLSTICVSEFKEATSDIFSTICTSRCVFSTICVSAIFRQSVSRLSSAYHL